jgi:hypothetical protein
LIEGKCFSRDLQCFCSLEGISGNFPFLADDEGKIVYFQNETSLVFDLSCRYHHYVRILQENGAIATVYFEGHGNFQNIWGTHLTIPTVILPPSLRNENILSSNATFIISPVSQEGKHDPQWFDV